MHQKGASKPPDDVSERLIVSLRLLEHCFMNQADNPFCKKVVHDNVFFSDFHTFTEANQHI